MNFDCVGRNSNGELYMKFNTPFTPVEKIQLLQRWIMVASVAYYEYDDNFVDDFKYDANAHQLVNLMNEFPEEAKQSRYYKYFYDYTGETGYHLTSRVEKDDSTLYRHIRIDALMALEMKNKIRKVSLNERI